MTNTNTTATQLNQHACVPPTTSHTTTNADTITKPTYATTTQLNRHNPTK